MQGRDAMPIFQRNKVKFFLRMPEQDYGGLPVSSEALEPAIITYRVEVYLTY